MRKPTNKLATKDHPMADDPLFEVVEEGKGGKRKGSPKEATRQSPPTDRPPANGAGQGREGGR